MTMEEQWNEWIGKKIFLVLKSGRRYSGIVDSVNDGLVSITDKFNEKVIFAISEISSMEEEQ